MVRAGAPGRAMTRPKLSKAIRERNDYAVVLEFGIAVAGVMIGFLMQTWKDVRAAAAREAGMEFRMAAGLVEFNPEVAP